MGELLPVSRLIRLPNPAGGKTAGGYSCESCRDTGWLDVFGEDGRVSGVKRCACLTARMHEQKLARIPPEYRALALATITPDPLRHARQAELWRDVKADPQGSWLLFGRRTGEGKSLVGWILYREAVMAGRPVLAMSLPDLLNEYRQLALGNACHAPAPAALRDDRQRWFVFLDEFDKARVTEFTAECLWSLMDAIYSFRHQLVITSNLMPDALRDHWSRQSEGYGWAIMRRMFELEGATSIEFDET